MRSAAVLLPPLLMKSRVLLRKSVEYAIIINTNINLRKCKLIFEIYYKKHPYSNAAAEARIILMHEYRPNCDKTCILPYLEHILEYHPESSLILTQFGSYLWEDSPQEAISYLQKALSVPNPHGDAYRLLGHAYERLGDYKTAWDYYTKSRQLVDTHPIDLCLEHILAIESGSPKISQIK